MKTELVEALTRAGKSVLILECRMPVRGSTAASTTMIQLETDVPLIWRRRLPARNMPTGRVPPLNVQIDATRKTDIVFDRDDHPARGAGQRMLRIQLQRDARMPGLNT